jgi:murein DD-endopeptidase MepM/ murein hydrolase activator NlpD
MSEYAAVFVRRNVVRFALTGLVGIWLSGCSQDMSRMNEPVANSFSNPFASTSNPFSNPFASASNTTGAAPTPKVASAPLGSNSSMATAARTAPPAAIASAPLPAPVAAAQPKQPVTGFSNGWTAVGGSPIIVAQGEDVDALSRRYGVPTSALLSANGLSSPAQVHGGMRLVVPVYNANGKSGEHKVAEATKPEATPKAKKKDAEVAEKSPAAVKPEKAAKTETADKSTSEPVKTAKTDLPPKTATAKTDPVQTGRVDSTGPAVTAQQADANGSSPEFRWPARGRIIQGFKAGGNDGINISVPEGTSVRAAENGVVAYAGSELKGYGNLVLIRHPNGFVSAYANNGELDVKRGDSVKRGQVIAKSGQSGNVNSPQLHFELRKGSTPVDPTAYLAGL